MSTKRPDQIVDFLRRKGFQYLGGGGFSDVFAAPTSDRVIKVNRRLDAWPEYILWAARNGYAGNLAPRVYSLRVYAPPREFSKPFYVAIVERLKETIAKTILKNQELDDIAYNICVAGYSSSATVSAKAEARFPGIAAFLEAYKAAFPHGNDFGYSNLMIRHDGSLCVTDPIMEAGHDPTPKRLRSQDIYAN